MGREIIPKGLSAPVGAITFIKPMNPFAVTIFQPGLV